MFSAESGGSKLAVYWLREQLKAWRFDIFDCQVGSDHLQLLGAEEWPRDQFVNRVHLAATRGHRRGPWQFEVPVPSHVAHGPSG